jgi:hypothetical protein
MGQARESLDPAMTSTGLLVDQPLLQRRFWMVEGRKADLAAPTYNADQPGRDRSRVRGGRGVS